MDFLDNVVKSSNSLLKERLSNPFGPKQAKQSTEDQKQTPPASDTGQIDSQSEASQGLNDALVNDQSSTLGEDGGRKDGDKGSQFAAIAADAEAVTQKAVQGAKNIGTFLFSMANKAGQTVSQTAKQVKQAVESTSILTDFTREQQEFVKEHGGSMQAGELPWADCPDESKAADIREQVLSLSQDKRNFVRSPPSNASFQFNPQQCYPIALTLLKEDPNLGKMRFELVPKFVNEDTFWRNYFYRVQSLKQMSDRGEDLIRHGWTSNRSSSGEGPDDDIVPSDEANHVDTASYNFDERNAQNPLCPNLDSSVVREPGLESTESQKLFDEADDLKSKLKELNIGSLDEPGCQDENDKWEEELQKDLQEFELISGDVSALDEEALDKDIMELKRSSKDIK